MPRSKHPLVLQWYALQSGQPMVVLNRASFKMIPGPDQLRCEGFGLFPKLFVLAGH